MQTKKHKRMKTEIEYIEAYYREHRQSPSIRMIARQMGISPATALRDISYLNETGTLHYDGVSIETAKTAKQSGDFIEAPLLGSISCGIPLLEEENIERYVNIPQVFLGEEKGSFFLLRANGDSMNGAGIRDGDIVIVRQQDEARDGQIVVAVTEGGETTLKRIYRDKRSRKVILHPENDMFPDILVDSCRIQGVAVRVLTAIM